MPQKRKLHVDERHCHWVYTCSGPEPPERKSKSDHKPNIYPRETFHRTCSGQSAFGRPAEGRVSGVRSSSSVGFVFGLAGITRLFAGVAPVVRLGAGLVMPPRRLVEDRQTLKGLTGKGLQTEEHNKSR